MEVENNNKGYNLKIPNIIETFEETDFPKKKNNGVCCFGKRHVVTLIGFLSCFFLCGARLVIGVAIVAMVKHGQANETLNLNNSEVSCPKPSAPLIRSTESVFQGEFDWSTELQGYLLGIGFLSYLITLVPGGRLADAGKSKLQLVISNAASGILTLISPFAARWHAYALMTVLFLRGISQAFTLPATYKLINNWIPKKERGTLSTLVSSGLAAGGAIGGIVAGWLCDSPGFGWPSAFYTWGAINVIFAFAIHFLCYEHPQNHPNITDEELKYICEGLESQVSIKAPPTPWRKIFSSVPCYALFYGLFGHYWSSTYFVTTHPTFMGTVLHYPMSQNGVTSCLPVMMQTVGGLLASIMCHWITKRNLIGITNLRKLATGIGTFGFTLCIVGIQLAGCDAMINIVCFTLSLLFTGINISGVAIVGMDMAPTFAGSIMGLAVSLANWSCVLIPIIAGIITKHETLSEWQIVFWINFAVVGSSGLVFVLFGSAEVQPWNYINVKCPAEVTFVEKRHSVKSKKIAINA